MMTILDRYITRQYVTNIAVLFTLLFVFVIVIDFSLNFDEYADIAERIVKRDGGKSAWWKEAGLSVLLVLDLWWPRLFQLYNFLLGVVLVGAMGFTCAQLVKHREFVAVLAGGLSLFRIARPIVAVAAALTLVQLVNRELILPELAPLLTRRKVDAGDHSLGSSHQPLCADSRGRLFYARSFDFDAETIDGLWVWERDDRGLMSRRITADSARWDPQARRWVLENGLAEGRSLNAGAQRAPEPVAHLETDLDPIALRLRRFEGYSSNLSTLQLSELLASYRKEPSPPARQIERLERVRFGRISGMLCGLLTLSLALPFFLRREPVNMLVQALMCAPITIVAFLGTLVGTTAAVPGLPPQVSVFIPAMVLIPLAIAAVSSVKT